MINKGLVECNHCGGYGSSFNDPDEDAVCSKCHGSGVVSSHKALRAVSVMYFKVPEGATWFTELRSQWVGAQIGYIREDGPTFYKPASPTRADQAYRSLIKRYGYGWSKINTRDSEEWSWDYSVRNRDSVKLDKDQDETPEPCGHCKTRIGYEGRDTCTRCKSDVHYPFCSNNCPKKEG